MKMNINLFGHYGSGKGTQRRLLMEKYGLGAFEPGEIIREEIDAQTPDGIEMDRFIAKGQLVPDSFIIAMMDRVFEKLSEDRGIVFDGIPRTMVQKKLFDDELQKFHRKTLNIELVISEETSFLRQVNRKEKRADQHENIARARIQQYKEFVKPVIDAYEQEGNMIRVNGEQPIETIFAEICKIVEEHGNHSR